MNAATTNIAPSTEARTFLERKHQLLIDGQWVAAVSGETTEMVKAKITPNDATWAQIYEQYKNGGDAIKIEASAHIPRVQQYLCPDFIGFPGKVQDVSRAKV